MTFDLEELGDTEPLFPGGESETGNSGLKHSGSETDGSNTTSHLASGSDNGKSEDVTETMGSAAQSHAFSNYLLLGSDEDTQYACKS